MNAFKFGIAYALLLAATAANAGQEKMLVCHVGNEAGPSGETYLDDPFCVPGDLNDYFCPDAGKIDLIVVAEKSAANHLDNSSHYWDGISDYDPIAMGASGDGTEDSDGNGVDDGCEIPDTCPCWDESELQAVTASNLYTSLSCDPRLYPRGAVLWTLSPAFPGTIFFAEVGGLGYGPYCSTDATGSGLYDVDVTLAESETCIAQIAQRCADIGYPIVPQ